MTATTQPHAAGLCLRAEGDGSGGWYGNVRVVCCAAAARSVSRLRTEAGWRTRHWMVGVEELVTQALSAAQIRSIGLYISLSLPVTSIPAREPLLRGPPPRRPEWALQPISP